MARQVGDKCKLMRPKAPRVGDKCGRQVGDKTNVNSYGPRQPGVGDKCGRQVGDKCKLMRPKAPRVDRQLWETSVNSCGPKHPEWETSVGDKWETSVKSCGPRHPEWQTSGDKCKFIRPKVFRMGDKCGRQGAQIEMQARRQRQNHAALGCNP